MFANEIETILNKDLKNYYNVIMINGPWGIGKTHYIINGVKLEKHIYISLFGKNNIAEIEKELYYAISKKGLKLTSGAYDLFQQVFSASFFGLSASLPKVNWINEEKIIKGFKKKNKDGENDTFIVVFDDLERKGTSLPIEELLGLIERISKADNIKIIVVANESKVKNVLNDSEKTIYHDFKEKVIQKTFQITNFAKEAPLNIISLNDFYNEEVIDKDDFALLLTEFIFNHKLKNLRTLEKAKPFLKEVFSNIDLELLRKEDILEIITACLSVITESIEELYKEEAKAIKKEGNWFFEEYQTIIGRVMKYYFKNDPLVSSKRGIVEALLNIYNNLDKTANFNGINNHFKELYSDNKNRPVEVFYHSESDLREYVNNFIQTAIDNFDSKYNLSSYVKEIGNVYEYANALNMESEIKKTKIASRLNEYVDNLDYTKNTIYQLLHSTDFHFLRNQFAVDCAKIAQDLINETYYKKLFVILEDNFNNNNYDTFGIEQLVYFFGSANKSNKKLYSFIKKKLIEKEFFIPNLSIEINDDIWSWGHNIWKVFGKMNGVFEDLQKEFIKAIDNKLSNATLLEKYRIESLNSQYIREKQKGAKN